MCESNKWTNHIHKKKISGKGMNFKQTIAVRIEAIAKNQSLDGLGSTLAI